MGIAQADSIAERQQKVRVMVLQAFEQQHALYIHDTNKVSGAGFKNCLLDEVEAFKGSWSGSFSKARLKLGGEARTWIIAPWLTIL